MQETHFKNLDSLRGLAALSVVISHICLADAYMWVTHTPLRIFSGGHEAVILFFILSGFVLSLQLERVPIPFMRYALRRVCRIYLPYLAVIAIGMMLIVHTKPVDLRYTGVWWASFWQTPITTAVIVHHALLIVPFDTGTIDGVIWSLIYEMRISLLMPLICYIVPRIGWIFSVFAALALTGISMTFLHTYPNADVEAIALTGAWSMTFHYTGMFVLGAMLAYKRADLIAAIARRKMANALAWGSIGVYAAAIPLSALVHHEGFPGDWLIAIGACGLLVSTFTDSFFSAFMRLAIPRFLGKISFSLYLIHLLVFITVFRLVQGQLSLGATMLVAFVLTFPIAWTCYELIEKPSILLSRRFTPRRASPTIVTGTINAPVDAAVVSARASVN